jgi:serine/threonine-protein kinase HipA
MERDGNKIQVGSLVCETAADAVFSYDRDYLKSGDAVPISLSLPLQEEPFNAQQTRIYFEGLLPEGFTRQSVARWMHVDEQDYISILHGLGQECLGAIQIAEQDTEVESSYESLSMNQVKNLAKEGATRSAQIVTKTHLSLTGASGKVGLYYDEAGARWYLPMGNAPSTHIVKQSHVRLNGIVTNEQLSLMTAEALGISVPQSFIINTGSAKDEEILFATKRYDRIMDGAGNTISGLPCPYRLHQEDFAQALGIPSAEKYERNFRGYMKAMFELLRTSSSNPIEDRIMLWKIIVFNYLIGNTDNHVKNYSLLYSKDMKSVRLAPAYDIVSTVIYEESTRDMAFHIGGEYCIDRMTAHTFRNAAAEVGLGEKMAMKYYEDMCNTFESALKESAYRLKQMGFQNAADIQERILRRK